MQVGIIGLGRMGANMVRRLLRGGDVRVVHEVSVAAVQPLVREGAIGAPSSSGMRFEFGGHVERKP